MFLIEIDFITFDKKANGDDNSTSKSVYSRLTSKTLESFRNTPAPPAIVSIVTEHVTNLPLSSGTGRKTNSDIVLFPSVDVLIKELYVENDDKKK